MVIVAINFEATKSVLQLHLKTETEGRARNAKFSVETLNSKGFFLLSD